jgi:hypothetical protein
MDAAASRGDAEAVSACRAETGVGAVEVVEGSELKIGTSLVDCSFKRARAALTSVGGVAALISVTIIRAVASGVAVCVKVGGASISLMSVPAREKVAYAVMLRYPKGVSYGGFSGALYTPHGQFLIEPRSLFLVVIVRSNGNKHGVVKRWEH